MSINSLRFIYVFFLLISMSKPTIFCQDILKVSVPVQFKYGIESQILELFAVKLNVEIKIIPAPFSRRLQFMKTGTTDMTAGLLKRPEREVYIHYTSIPYKLKTNKMFFVLKGNRFIIKKYEDLYKLSIGTKRGSKYFIKFDDDSNIRKIVANSIEQNIQMLLNGRIDAFIFSEGPGLLEISKMGLNEKIETAEYSYSKVNPVYIGISKKSTFIDQIERIEDILLQLIENGEIDRIIENYYTSKNLPVPEYK